MEEFDTSEVLQKDGKSKEIPVAPSLGHLKEVELFSTTPRDTFEPVKLHFAINNEDYVAAKREVDRGINNINYIMHGNTPLTLAVLRQNVDIAKLLMESGADINMSEKTRLQRQPLHIAAKLGSLPLVKLLIQYGANIQGVDMDDMTALNIASYTGRTDIVKHLCAVGAHIETKDARSKTPLFNAVENNSFETVKLLCDLGTCVNTHDINGWTPLIHSVMCGFFHLTKYLLSIGANVNDTDRNGEGALHFACARLSPAHITCLCNANADFYTRHLQVITPTVRLAINSVVNEVELIDLLVDYGADVNVLSGFGETPLEVACSENKFNLVEFLLNAGAVLHQEESFIDKVMSHEGLSYLLQVCEVKSLQDQCKFSIRKYIQRHRHSIRTDIKKLPLPNRLQNFLQLNVSFP